jgi:hypothetical protein
MAGRYFEDLTLVRIVAIAAAIVVAAAAERA